MTNPRVPFFSLLLALLFLASCGGGGEGAPAGGGGGAPQTGSNSGGGGSGGGDGDDGGVQESDATLAMNQVAQEGSRVLLEVEKGGIDPVLLLATEGDLEEEIEVVATGTHEFSFRIPRRGEPLALRSMTLEAFDEFGVSLDTVEIDVIEPLDLPTHGLLAMNQVDQLSLQNRHAEGGRAGQVLNTMMNRLSDRLAEGVQVPGEKGGSATGYRCPTDGSGLEVVEGDPSRHRCRSNGEIWGPDNTPPDVYAAIMAAYRSLLHGRYAVEAFEMGVAYQLSEDQGYADHAGEILLQYAAAYPGYPLSGLHGETAERSASRTFAQSLDEARWIVELARALDLIRGSGALDSAEEQQVIDGLILPSAELLAAKRPEYGLHNIQSWHNSAVFLTSLQSGRFDLAREAVYGEFGVLDQLERGRRDGLWQELSFGYHFFTTEGMMPLLLGLRRAKIQVNEQQFHDMLTAPYAMVLPDGSLPSFNDGFPRTYGKNLMELYELAAGLFSDPEIAGPLAAFGRGDSVGAIIYGPKTIPMDGWRDKPSANLADAGMAALRSGPPQQQTLAMVDYGPHGGDHGHNDKLGLMVWLKGQPLIQEAGHFAYVEPWYRGWYKRTLAHSTVVRDGLDQEKQSQSSAVLRFDQDAGATTLVVESSEAYPDAKLRRLVHTTPNGRVADMFEATDSVERTWDYVLHGVGTASTEVTLVPTPSAGFGGAYNYLSDIQYGAVDGDFQVVFQTPTGPYTVTLMGEPGTVIALAQGRGGLENSKHPVLLVRRTGKSALFSALLSEGSGLPAGLTVSLDAVERDLLLEEPEAAQEVRLSLD